MSGYAVYYWPGQSNAKYFRSIDGVKDLFDGEEYVEFSDGPPTVTNGPLTADEILSAVKGKRDQLLSVATNIISPLQDAVDLGSATEAEKELLNELKLYRIDLLRIDKQEGYPEDVTWPSSPSS